ncbi:MAG: hypothetical protein JO171_09175 [Paludibacterium sp.]|uniref:DUF6200 domain-containing protein n=1 Tax=Paludibacterium sp. TaxID=1917523 RepID=UPI0025DA5C96|nr:hypothetical protein [Paludibacterium sp.]MBV8047312.1 hypothetical protein [Paludibacterium sp.]MBV8646194.1 hypothetical protein [Paludibacterium sp.]
MATETQATTHASTGDGCGPNPVVIKLGKKKRKDIRKLSKGKGRLFAKVVETHAHLRTEGAADGPVFVVVKQKKRRGGKLMFNGPW